ncbi:MAG: hypothetical protein ACUVWA_15410, partial [Candidatus Oleimicrobiaceae bacterium]
MQRPKELATFTGLALCLILSRADPRGGSLAYAQSHLSPDLAIGISAVGELSNVAASNGLLPGGRAWLWPLRPNHLYKGSSYFEQLSLFLGIPQGPWSPKVFDPATGDSVSLGPTVSESCSGSMDIGYDWGPCPGSRGKHFSGDVLVGHLYPGTQYSATALMATSTIPESWPLDLYGFRSWPGPWAREATTRRTLKGEFISDQDLFFCFTDKGYATRVHREAQGYEVGAKVEASVHAFQDSYAMCFIFYDFALVNTTQWNYRDVYLGLFFTCWFGPIWWGNIVEYLHTPEYDARHDSVYAYDLAYFYKDESARDYIRTQAGDPDMVIAYAGVELLDTPLAPARDGVDNDRDGEVDEPEGERLGLTGWHLYEYAPSRPGKPSVNYHDRKDRELIQYKVLSGDTSGLSAEVKGAFFVPDTTTGLLDPHFDCTTTIKARGPAGLFNTSLMSTGPFDWASGDTVHLA